MRVLYKTADGLTFSAQDGTLLTFEADTWLITDRTQQDVNYVKQLVAKIVAGTATPEELSEWNSATLKGSYNYTDLNRVNAAMEQLKAQLESYGYAVPGYRKVQITHTKLPSSRLPSGYTELKYIEGTGTQYINTGFVLTNTSYVKMRLQPTGTAKTSNVFGSRTSADSNNITIMQFGSSLQIDYRTYQANRFSAEVGTNIVDVSIAPSVCTVGDKSFSISGANAFVTPDSAYIFHVSGSPYSQYKASFKLYSCQIYDNGTLVRDYIPCLNPDGVAGLYDKENKKFYGNAGTGSFIGGAVVEWDAIGNEQIDYDPYLWYEIDTPTSQLMESYLANVQSVRNVLELFDSTPATPESMSELTYQMANAIEQILVDCQNVITSMSLVLPKTGQPTVFCGFCWYVLENT